MFGIGYSFFIRRWTFDVRCSTFIFQNNSVGWWVLVVAPKDGFGQYKPDLEHRMPGEILPSSVEVGWQFKAVSRGVEKRGGIA